MYSNIGRGTKMYINIGSNAVIVDVDIPELSRFIGTTWIVKNLLSSYYPARALLYHHVYGEINLPIKCLEVIPPENSPISHDETVRITKSFHNEMYSCRTEMIGQTGKVRGYDTRNNFYFVKTTDGNTGWFPLASLMPLAYKGECFYYPNESVIYENKTVRITDIRKTRFGSGQLLQIGGRWVPSTDVKPK